METKDIIVIGAGPVGLFTVFEAGLLGLNCVLIDNLDKPGGVQNFIQKNQYVIFRSSFSNRSRVC